MKLHAPFVQLPLRFDAQRLADEVDALGDAPWRPHPQGFPGNSMLPLVALGGDPDDEGFQGAMGATPALQACPYLRQALSSLGATVGRTRLMRLSGGSEVTRHADQHYYWAERVRVHLPIVTQPGVRFECGEAAVNMAAGECWIFDTWRQHRVLNDGEQSRIHLVCDTVGGEGFWGLVDRGRAVGAGSVPTGWQARMLAFDAAARPDLAFEAYNLPTVMSPWELRQRLDFLLDEMQPSPYLPGLRRQVEVLYRAWRGVWAANADAVEARPAYRRLLERFLQQVRPVLASIALRNELPMFPALMLGVAGVAVAADAAEAPGAPTKAAPAPAMAHAAGGYPA